LLLRERDQATPRPIPGAQNGWAPCFARAGDRVAFYTGFPGALRVVPLAGGSPLTLVADSTYGNGGAWSRDGWIYYIGGTAGELALRRIRPRAASPSW
jgi:hypothetical protein